jgi:hypothetical protein
LGDYRLGYELDGKILHFYTPLRVRYFGSFPLTVNTLAGTDWDMMFGRWILLGCL